MQKIEINKTDELDYHTNEAYKSLRTNIQFSGENVKVIAITSCMPNEGKSSVAMNLACSLAEAARRVLYIDADMRKSVLVGRYKMTHANFGLSHFLSGQKSLEEVLAQTNISRLHMIVAGPVPPNPAELLEGKRFGELIKAAREVYDYIIIDTPPVGVIIDSVIVAKQCDGIAMVIAADEVSYKFSQKAKSQLEVAGCRILGAILNKVDLRRNGRYGSRYYNKYYRKYYGSYYGAGTYGKEEE